MSRWLLNLVAAAALWLGAAWLCHHALAEEPTCAPDFPSRCSAPIEAGQAAPFSGQVLTPNLAIFLGQSTNNCEGRIALAVTATGAVHREDKKLLHKNHKVDLRIKDVEIDLLRNATDRFFYEHPAFLVPVTAVLTTLMIGAAVLIACELSGCPKANGS